MEKEDFVTNISLSKRLKNAGVPQNSQWYWVDKKLVYCCIPYLEVVEDEFNNAKEILSAFTMNELAVLLIEKYGN